MYNLKRSVVSFFILSIFSGSILILPTHSFAQNKGMVSGNPATKQSGHVVVSVIDAPPEDAPALSKVPVPVNTPPTSVVCTTVAGSTEYTVGTNDILDINVLQPDQLLNTVTVSPDGTITFPYIGTVPVRGKTLAQIQDMVQKRLGDGFMKYPVVSVDLKESHSRRFFVYGEVSKPGAYDIEDNMTVLRGISTAGGFTQFGSASRVKVLRPKRGSGGYDVIKVSIKDVMDGVEDADPAIEKGDIIVVSEGVF